MNNREIEDHLADISSRKSKKTENYERQEIFIPVQGFVWFYPEEIFVIDHPAFQRLAQIHQLGAAHWVYRGATHNRIEHSMGTVAVSQRILEAVTHNCSKPPKKQDEEIIVAHAPTESERRFTRLAALLHDIGHLPYGHTFEDELHLLPRHDSENRFNTILDYDYNSPTCDEPVPTLRKLINDLYQFYIPDGCPLKPDQLLLLILKSNPNSLDDKVEKEKKGNYTLTDDDKKELVSQKALARQGFRVAVCTDIVANTISADLLDYVYRDWYHTGRNRYFDERLLHYMEIRGENEKPETDRLVVTLGDPPRVRTDGVSAILELLETRYNIAEAVIFHRTKMNAMSLLERALTFCIFKDGNIKQLKATLERELLKKSEDGFVSLLVDNPELLFGDIKQEYSKKVKSLALRFQRRDYYDTLYLISRQEKRLDIKAEPVQEYYAFGNDAPINRMKALDILEDDFDFPRGSITMYCPDPKMNSKLARVRIYFDSRMGTLDKLEDDLEEHMTGGHLKAQLKRFRKLWRVSFFINPTVLPREKKERKDLREVIQKTIETLVLGLGDSGEKRTEALKIAKSLCSLPEWSEKYEPSEYIEGAPHYPSGFPCVKSFLVKKQKDSRRVEAETERWVTEDEILTVLNRFQSPLVNVDIRRSVENEVAKFVQNFRVGFHLPVHARFRGLLSSINITVHPERNRIGVTPDEVRSGLDFLLIEAKGADDKA